MMILIGIIIIVSTLAYQSEKLSKWDYLILGYGILCILSSITSYLTVQ